MEKSGRGLDGGIITDKPELGLEGAGTGGHFCVSRVTRGPVLPLAQLPVLLSK
jgi:hypothetical protein